MAESDRDSDAEELIEALLAECLAEPEPQRAASIARRCREHPEHAAELRARLQALAAIGIDVTTRATPFPERLGDFRLQRPLGKGGMGIVYLAEQESLGRQVALKLIRPENLYFPGARERFRREVQAAARLAHPGIVPVYCVGEEQGIPYFAMERIVGCSLDDVLHELAGRRAEQLTGADLESAVARCTARLCEASPRPAVASTLFQGTWLQACVRICQSAAATLDYAHARGVLHRDIKPSNVLVTEAGRVTIVDFGLASFEGTSKLTRTGSQMGSLPYMSPEQLKGEAALIDARTDVYALGITLYELLTLELPYKADSNESTRRVILDARPRSLRERNPAVLWDAETVCLKAMERDREHRYASAAELAVDLENVLEHRLITARRPGPMLRVRRFMQRHPTISVALLLGLLGLGIVPAAWFEISSQHAENQQARAEIEHKEEKIRRLSDQDRARQLLLSEPELWPATAAQVPAMDAWLAAARDLLQRLPGYEAGAAGADDAAHALVVSVRAVRERRVLVQARRDYAASAEQRTIAGEDARRAWEDAVAEIAASENYGGLELTPVPGFLPLGRDPESLLWEFWQVMSGAPPARDASTGRWQIGAATGMVFVLLPGGTFTMGTRVPLGQDDPESPPQQVTLAPFLIAKYEMTQGQWARATGSDPASVIEGADTDVDGRASLASPVETVSWLECDALLSKLELSLPTEAQWEYACRGGTTARSWFGDDREPLRRFANVASREFTRASNTPAEAWADGFAGTAPVGLFDPNPFGLHDMLGNVSEWCMDWYQRYDQSTPRPGDGLREKQSLAYRIQRGGSFALKANMARSAARAYESPEFKAPSTGVRAVKNLK
ncbi:MAG: bifunctional serine/threonine-protein kinase/formylglycine-generating enzyme family protein [Planctomycetota bacterium]